MKMVAIEGAEVVEESVEQPELAAHLRIESGRLDPVTNRQARWSE